MGHGIREASDTALAPGMASRLQILNTLNGHTFTALLLGT